MVRITDKDHGYARMRKALTESISKVRVGVDDRPHEPDGTPTDVIGAAHEFGLGNVPQRSWLRGWVDQNERAIRDRLHRLVEGVIRGEMSWSEAQKQFGAYCVEGIRERIMKELPPPILAETFQRKKGPFPEVPLVDTEQLINAITYELESR